MHKVWAGHIANVRPDNLPNSLRKVLPLALVYSTSPPVSVVGTVHDRSDCDNFLGSRHHLIFSRKREITITARLNKKTDLPIFSASQFRHGIFNTMLKLAQNVLPQLITIDHEDGNINPLSIGYASVASP